MTATQRWDDIDMLVRPFGERVTTLLCRLVALGHSPLLWETYRSRERAAMLAKKGTGTVDSMHCYGLAADIICRGHKWDCAKHGCGFFKALEEQAAECGLVSGAKWRMRDLPHVQAIPVSLQAAIRSARSGDEREAIVIASLGKVRP